MRVIAAILAGGRGERFGGDKTSAMLGGKPVWKWSFDAYASHPLVDGVGLVGSASNLPNLSSAQALFTIEGGETRQDSSRLAVNAAEGDIVLLHDAARPFVSQQVIADVIAAVQRTGAAAPGIPVSDTLRIRQGDSYELLDRSKAVAMQTPQGGLRDLLVEAHSRATQTLTDEMALVEALGHSYEIVAGDSSNFKITTMQDLERARAMVGGVEFRTGIGYDIHAFSTEAERPLMLGGIRFEGAPGLEGHSDADVVIHAVVDALLGAAGLGDIGQHFPNTDPRWRNEPSSTFLAHAAKLLCEAGWSIVNVDITMIGEKPKVMARSAEVRTFLSDAIGVESSRVSFKATTNEGMGSLGRAEGIAAYAVATLKSRLVHFSP